MGNDLGTLFMSQVIGQHLVYAELYGKSKPKNKSFIKTFWKKVSR